MNPDYTPFTVYLPKETIEFFRQIARQNDRAVSAEMRRHLNHTICGVVSASGANGEPLACGWPKGHESDHSWATLPTYLQGKPI